MRSESQIQEFLRTSEAREKMVISLLVDGKIPTIGELNTIVTIINKYDVEIQTLKWVLDKEV